MSDLSENGVHVSIALSHITAYGGFGGSGVLKRLLDIIAIL